MIRLQAVYIVVSLLLAGALYAQGGLGEDNSFYTPVELKLQEKRGLEFSGVTGSTALLKKSDAPTGMFAGLIFLTFINPIVVFEDKKVFIGLTKEISKSFYPYGRLSFEYSFLFRTFNKNHFRFSYNYDHVTDKSGDWIIFVVSPGAGFFSDTETNGIFVQGSGGMFFPTPLFMGHLYLKYRFTKVFDKNRSDIHDISLGMGFVF
ncbi:MAG TPA: hypothetical protein PK753_00125 [Ignavibacteria bacterium]|nr:hypothetical protein [Ignavibacteria bacterium]